MRVWLTVSSFQLIEMRLNSTSAGSVFFQRSRSALKL